jgi:hypothetical protein
MTIGFQEEIVLRVDFNNVDSRGRIKGSLRHASSDRRPEVGEIVYLHDHEGNACNASVDELRGQIVVCEPDWSSWAHEAPTGAFQLAVA